MEIILFFLKLMVVIVELGIDAFLCMLLWFPLRWSSHRKFSSYTSEEQIMLVLLTVITVGLLGAIVFTIKGFFY